MFKSNGKHFLLIILWSFSPKTSHLLFSQNYTLSNWTVEDGLSSNDISDILQDKNGFVWVATEHGLNKFDGYSFQKYRYNPSDSTSIGANFINNIWRDREDNIWASLGVGVLSKYERLTQKFTNYTFEDDNTFIFDVKYISGYGICVATNEGLFCTDDLTNRLKHIPLNLNSESKHIFKIFPASGEKVYLNTTWGFELWNLDSNSVDTTFFIGQSDTFGVQAFIVKFHENSEGKVWARTKSGYLIQSEDGRFFKKSYPENHESEIEVGGEIFISEPANDSVIFLSKSGKLLIQNESDTLWSIFPNTPGNMDFAFQDQDKNIWICTEENELFKRTGNEWEFAFNFGDKLKFWEIRQIFVDENNGIWFATRGKGIWRIYNRKWPISTVKNKNTNGLIDFEITSLSPGNKEYMWLGTWQKLYKYYFENEQLIPVFSNSEKSPIAGLSINGITDEGHNNICIATQKGVIFIDENGQNFRHQKTYNIDGVTGNLNLVRTVLYTSENLIWIGTTQGLFLFNSEDNSFKHYGPTAQENRKLKGQDIHCLHSLNDTSFLVGYTKYGAEFVTFDSSDYSIETQKIVYENLRMEQVEYATINTFYRDSSEYWAGSFSKGLLKIDLENLTMRPLSEDFPIIPNVKGIQKGKDGNLWVSSIDGLRSVNPHDLTFYRFSKASGLLSNHFIRECAVQDSKGNLYFASKNGLNKINPSKWDNQDTIATPILTAFKKYDESVVFDRYINEIETIILTYQDDFITFEFVSPTFDNPQDVEYAYQLEGFDPNWHYCEIQRSVTYTNLAPGEYVFKIQAGNKGGFLNSELKQIQIIVTPPFWQTSWFVFVMICLLIFSYWAVLKIQSQIRKNRLKTIAKIRQKAADDFHDELGHRLTKIGLFVESLMLQKDDFPEKSATTLQKIQDNANELYHSTKDFIWAINPSKDSVIELFILLRDFGNELFDDTNIQFSAEGLKEEFEDYLLNMDLKRQLVLIFKEAMNNALKHSDSSNVVFRIEECGKHLKLTLRDDGHGFVLNREKFGYGLNSMLNRSKKVGGKLEVNSRVGEGTEIIFKL